MRPLVVVLCATISFTGAATTGLRGQSAQEESPASFCWRGQALPACRDFAIFELEGSYAAASTRVVHESSVVTTRYPVFENELKWHPGAMRNLSKDWALGGTVSVGTGSPTPLPASRPALARACTSVRVRAAQWRSQGPGCWVSWR